MDHTEEILQRVFPSNHQPTEVLEPGKQPFDLPAAAIPPETTNATNMAGDILDPTDVRFVLSIQYTATETSPTFSFLANLGTSGMLLLLLAVLLGMVEGAGRRAIPRAR